MDQYQISSTMKLYILLYLFALSEENELQVQIGHDALFSWPLVPKPHPNEQIWIINKHGNNVFSVSVKGSLISKSYKGRIDSKRYTTGGNIEFTLKHSKKSDAGIYNSSYTAGIFYGQELILLGKPKRPTIQIIQQPILENTMLLKCLAVSTSISFSLNMSMDYNWIIDENLNRETGRISYDGSNFEMTNVIMEDTGKSIACQAFEKASVLSEESEPYVMDVHYGPHDLYITPNIYKYRLPLGFSLHTLTCDASCNPICNYTWKKNDDDDDDLFNHFERKMRLKMVDSGDTGEYFCRAENYLDHSDSRRIEVLVSDAPGRPYVKENYPPIENKDLLLECTVYMGNNQTLYKIVDYDWKVNGDLTQQSERTVKLGNLFLVKYSKTEDNGVDITCRITTANGQWSNYSKPYRIISRYGPKKVQLTTDQAVLSVSNGSFLPNISCSAKCYPSCSYKWYKNGDINQNIIGRTLSLGKIYSGKCGKYHCVAYNEHGSETSANFVLEIKDFKTAEKPAFALNIKIIITASCCTLAFCASTIVFAICCCRRLKKRKKRIKTKIALQNIKDKLNRLKVDEIRETGVEESPIYNSIGSQDDSKSEIEDEQSSDDLSSQSISEYDDAEVASGQNSYLSLVDDERDYERDDERGDIQNSSYEDLKTGTGSRSYEQIPSERNEIDRTESVRRLSSDVEGNMADDEISTSGSSLP